MLRRDFIASSFAGSCLLTLGVTDVTAAPPPEGRLLQARGLLGVAPATPTLLLRMAEHESIANGICEALAQWGQAPALERILEPAMLFDGHSLAELLVGHSGHRLVALIDDGADVLLNELLRGLRADVLWSGHHAGGRDDAGASRHNLWMAAGLSVRSADESEAPASDARTEGVAPSFRGPWQLPLGHVLGWVAAGRPVPPRVAEFERSGGARLDSPAVRVNSLIAVLRTPSMESTL